MGIEIMQALVCSVAHVTQEEADAMKADNPPGKVGSAMVWDYGFMLHIGEDGDVDPDTLGVSAGFTGAIKVARANKLEWVRFDTDGPLLDNVPTYTW